MKKGGLKPPLPLSLMQRYNIFSPKANYFKIQSDIGFLPVLFLFFPVPHPSVSLSQWRGKQVFHTRNLHETKKTRNFVHMTDEVKDFINALDRYVRSEVAASGMPADYNTEALRVADARNHLFHPAGRRATDESEDIYALRDLCRVDEDTMEVVPDRARMAAVARNYF